MAQFSQKVYDKSVFLEAGDFRGCPALKELLLMAGVSQENHLTPIINLGIVAHVDAGKTTLTEQMLYLSGVLRTPGSVDSGTAQTDWLEIERRRGISVRSSSTTLSWKGVQLNLIDTPGHVDFAGEVQRSLSVLDAAVLLVSAAEGIQAQTEALWKALTSLRIPTLLCINKIDRAGVNLTKLMDELRKQFSSAILPLQRVEGEGSREAKVIPLSWEHSALADDAIALTAEEDEEIGTLFLEDQPVPEALLRRTVRKMTGEGMLYPLVFASAAQGTGVSELIDAVCDLLPFAQRQTDGPLSGVVYKIEHDKTMGKAAHVRLFSGKIQNRDAVMLRGQAPEDAEKVTQIRRVMGNRYLDMGSLCAGDIGALYGMSQLKTGDILGEAALRREYTMATPLLKVRVYPEGEEQLTALVSAVRELAEEDPLLDMEWEREERELSVSITGVIQLEVLSALLADRFGMKVSFSQPSVIYKETPAKAGVGGDHYTMPKPCWACIDFAMEPLPRGSGLVFESQVQDRQIMYRYQTHIRTALPDALKQGLYGWEVTDLKVTLIGGSHHLIHTHPLDFFTATPMAVMNTLENTGTVLLEPMTKVRMTAPEEFAGRLIGDIIAMRGTFDSPVMSGGKVTIEAVLPVASSMDYPVNFGILTGGKGVLSSQFAGYQPCPLELGAVAKRRGIDPRDRAKWILHARSALQ